MMIIAPRNHPGSRKIITLWCAVVLVMVLAPMPAHSQLSVDYYLDVCPNLTNIVRDAMIEAGNNDPVNFPAIIRLFAHDAFVNGVDGSVLLDTVPGQPAAEKEAPVSIGLFGFEAIENAKFLVEDACPGVVSCADILTLSAQISVELTGGPVYESLLGRKDSTTSLLTDAQAQVPTPDQSMAQLTANFAARGLTQQDLAALVGAHSIGFAHCESFSRRIYDWNATVQFDPSLDPTLAEQLRDVCSRHPDPSTVQPLDISTIEQFDEMFYFNLQIQEGLLQSDQLIGDHPATSGFVNTYANNQNAFFNQFVISMIKLGNWSVLTGQLGEIRTTCNSTLIEFVTPDGGP